MGAPVRVVHEKDPAEEIREDVGKLCDGIQVLGADVLIVMYERVGQNESKTAGGLILVAHKNGSANDDKFQGKVGLVMKMGPLAFQDDDSHRWCGVAPKVGDWVMVNVGETFSFDLPVYRRGTAGQSSPDGERRGRVVQDVYVKGIVSKDCFDAIW